MTQLVGDTDAEQVSERDIHSLSQDIRKNVPFCTSVAQGCSFDTTAVVEQGRALMTPGKGLGCSADSLFLALGHSIIEPCLLLHPPEGFVPCVSISRSFWEATSAGKPSPRTESSCFCCCVLL